MRGPWHDRAGPATSRRVLATRPISLPERSALIAAPRTGITLYLTSTFPGRDELLATLGKHKASKGCVYIKKLADVDIKVLEQMIAATVGDIKNRTGYVSSSTK